MKKIELFISGCSAIAAIASAYAAFSLNSMQENQNEFLERMVAIEALSDWSERHTQTGGHCMAMLAQYSKLDFQSFTNRANYKIQGNQRTYADRCFVAYSKKFDEDKDNILNNDEFSFVAQQVTSELNNYETLALIWDEVGEVAKKTICQQAKIGANAPHREFQKVASDTKWWNYPNFSRFISECG